MSAPRKKYLNERQKVTLSLLKRGVQEGRLDEVREKIQASKDKIAALCCSDSFFDAARWQGHQLDREGRAALLVRMAEARQQGVAGPIFIAAGPFSRRVLN